MADEKRAILIKPGDVLLIGGFQSWTDQVPDVMREFKEITGVAAVVVFADDIQIDSLTAEQVAALTITEEAAPAGGPHGCPETVWDGPYSFVCNKAATVGVCHQHGRFREEADGG